MKRKLGILVNTLKAIFHAVVVRKEKWNEMVVENYHPVYVNKKGEVLYCQPEMIDNIYEIAKDT